MGWIIQQIRIIEAACSKSHTFSSSCKVAEKYAEVGQEERSYVSIDEFFYVKMEIRRYDPLILRGARSRSRVRYLGQISAVRFMRHSGETSTVRSTKTKKIQALSSYRESIKRADKTQACKQSQVRNKPSISSYISFIIFQSSLSLITSSWFRFFKGRSLCGQTNLCSYVLSLSHTG